MLMSGQSSNPSGESMRPGWRIISTPMLTSTLLSLWVFTRYITEDGYRYTLVQRLYFYSITVRYRFPKKRTNVFLPRRIFSFYVMADQNDNKMAVIFSLYVAGGQWVMTGYWISVLGSVRGCLTAFWHWSFQELYQELETQRGLTRGNTRTGSRKTYASVDITRWARAERWRSHCQKTDTHQLTKKFLRVCSHDKQHQTE